MTLEIPKGFAMVRINIASASASGSSRPAGGREPKQRSLFDCEDRFTVPFTVLFDHRERAGGWTFKGLSGGSKRKHKTLEVPMREVHLVTADYTVEGCDVYIERKSHSDFIGSLGGGHERLEAEFERMRVLAAAGAYCCMIVESSLDRIIEELESPLALRKLSAASVLGVVASWPMRFNVPILFAGSRGLAESLAFRVMEKCVERTEALAQ